MDESEKNKELDDAMRDVIGKDDEQAALKAQAENHERRLQMVQDRALKIYNTGLFLWMHKCALLQAGFSATEAQAMTNMVQVFYLEEQGL